MFACVVLISVSEYLKTKQKSSGKSLTSGIVSDDMVQCVTYCMPACVFLCSYCSLSEDRVTLCPQTGFAIFHKNTSDSVTLFQSIYLPASIESAFDSNHRSVTLSYNY